ncbi:hypothetical protein PENSPDRAFT_756755 [Peniophora sp. CONT]|nr:hypothetical protein PENSPDRAFT_756755 [Peniophora sp. CONT]
MEKVQLFPPLFGTGKDTDFAASGRTLSMALSSRDLSAAVFASGQTGNQSARPTVTGVQDVYTASFERVPTADRRAFITDTSVVFAALQNLRLPEVQAATSITGDASYQTTIKLALDYVALIKDAWVQASSRPGKENEADHYRVLYSCMSLFVALYLPENDQEYSPVGEELMEWLNFNFINPTTEEGDQLSAQERPWEDTEFWPYLMRTVLRGLSKSSEFFIKALTRHPSEHLSTLAEHLGPVLLSQPRLVHYTVERDFVIAQRRWKERVRTLRLELDRIPDQARRDRSGDWWAPMSSIVGILEGRPDAIQDVCLDLGGDWKELCAAWGIFVDHRLLRQDLPEVVSQILDTMPPDPTDTEDVILASLFSGKPGDALSQASKHDPWLSAHWSDLMENLDLIDSAIDPGNELTTRQQYVLAYAESLRSDPALWRITVAYMGACGETGLRRADEVLLRVPIMEEDKKPVVNVEADGEAVPETLQEVVKMCYELGREHVRREVCSIAAQKFMQRRQYGMAVSYLTSAENWTGLGRVVDSILDEYIANGPGTFMQLVSSIAPSLQELQIHPDVTGVFIRRLVFAVQYAEFHQKRVSGDYQDAAVGLEAMLQQDVAPKAWWAVLLCDAVELLDLAQDGVLLFSSVGAVQLLHRLEELQIAVAQGSSDDYLAILKATLKGASGSDALRRLQRTRLALAKYYAACTVMADDVERWHV